MIQDGLKYKTVNSLFLKYNSEHFIDDDDDGLDNVNPKTRSII